jgi:DeoR family fructose operon transcriptional repressor
MDVVLIGGKVVPERRSIYGPIAVEQVSKYHVNKAFIGTDGISLKRGLTAYDSNESNVSRMISASAEKVFLLCDSSKIEIDSFYIFYPISGIDVFITDDGIDGRIAEEYRAAEINLVIANVNT